MELQFEGPLIGQFQMDLFVSWIFVFSPNDPFFKTDLYFSKYCQKIYHAFFILG